MNDSTTNMLSKFSFLMSNGWVKQTDGSWSLNGMNHSTDEAVDLQEKVDNEIGELAHHDWWG